MNFLNDYERRIRTLFRVVLSRHLMNRSGLEAWQWAQHITSTVAAIPTESQHLSGVHRWQDSWIWFFHCPTTIPCQFGSRDAGGFTCFVKIAFRIRVPAQRSRRVVTLRHWLVNELGTYQTFIWGRDRVQNAPWISIWSVSSCRVTLIAASFCSDIGRLNIDKGAKRCRILLGKGTLFMTPNHSAAFIYNSSCVPSSRTVEKGQIACLPGCKTWNVETSRTPFLLLSFHH